ncbi:MAG: lipoprotein [Labilithrix sp.]|nr:lipoprotein [Labilithrix sp.]MCW5812289.1 lipoprotein [Labilithrix sp.]
MRKSIVAAVALALVAGCTAATTEEGIETTNLTNDMPARLTRSLKITEVAAYQGLKTTIAKNGAAVAASLPILAGRDAMVRVYVTPTSTATSEPVTAVLEVADDDGDVVTFSDTKTLSGASVESDLATTFNFTVPGASLPAGAKFKVSLTSASGTPLTGAASDARFPKNGARTDFGARTTAQKLRIVLVPIKYTFGGANFLPDTTPAQLDLQRRTFMQLYPLSDVEISMHAPFEFNQEIKSNGTGISALLRAMLTLRAQDGIANDVYYYGWFTTKATFQEYCAAGCVTGLSGLYGPDAVTGRASVGVGYTGASSAMTMAHEIGHAHGRPHAPCGGAAGPDPAFPNPEGGIGAWGYAPSSQRLVDPATAKDLMGYCQPKWISGYNYNKLLERLTYVNAQAAAAPPPGSFAVKHPFQFVEVSPDGELSFGERIKLAEEPTGDDTRAVTFEDANGKTISTGQAVFTPYDHVGGGYLLVPEDVEFSAVDIAGLGRATR